MKILFVYPNLQGQLGFHYGLASLSAVLKQAGHETALINLNEALEPAPEPRAFARRVADMKPGLVGFSVVTPQYATALKLARAVKAECDVPVVFGGVHATMVPGEIAAEHAVDYVCVGEGETALLRLVEALESGGDAGRIPNIWHRTADGVVSNPVGPLPRLDELPPMDFELFDFQTLTDKKGGWVGLMASRGCPFRCSYCFNHKMVEIYRRDLGIPVKELGYMRWAPVEQVLSDVSRLLDRYTGIEMFIFDDDLFTHDPGYVAEFCRRYPAVSEVPFTVNAHVRRFDRPTAQALKSAGCRMVKFGLESGSPRIRSKVMNRLMSDDTIASAFACAHDAGLITSAFVMMGMPRETPADLEATWSLLARVKPGRFRWSTFFPFPGTRAFDLALEDGSLDAARLGDLQNFFGDSCLDLGEEMNRLVKRSRWTFPWSVNARLGGLTGRLYDALVETFHAMDDDAFAASTADFRRVDAQVAAWADRAGENPYRIRFNDFMAVRRGAGAEDDA